MCFFPFFFTVVDDDDDDVVIAVLTVVAVVVSCFSGVCVGIVVFKGTFSFCLELPGSTPLPLF